MSTDGRETLPSPRSLRPESRRAGDRCDTDRSLLVSRNGELSAANESGGADFSSRPIQERHRASCFARPRELHRTDQNPRLRGAAQVAGKRFRLLGGPGVHDRFGNISRPQPCRLRATVGLEEQPRQRQAIAWLRLSDSGRVERRPQHARRGSFGHAEGQPRPCDLRRPKVRTAILRTGTTVCGKRATRLHSSATDSTARNRARRSWLFSALGSRAVPSASRPSGAG